MVLLVVRFPLLFGQGPVGGAVGFAGGFAGTKMGGQMGGFAGGLNCYCCSSTINYFQETSMTELGQAFSPVNINIDAKSLEKLKGLSKC